MEMAKAEFSLQGKTALVSGAGRGIGLAAAQALAAAGAKVVLVSRTGAEVAEAAQAIRDAGGEADHAVLDVNDAPAFAELVAARGPVHVLVNCAGTNRPAPFLEVTEEDYDAIFRINTKAAFFCSQAVARNLVAHGSGGSIIHISSQMGLVGGRRRTVYCATKHAMEGMSKAMALDLAPHGIRVNTLCPTFTETPLTRPFFQDPVFLEETLAQIPLGRLGHVNDLVGAVVFLASEASGLITGTSLVVDGGWTAK